MSSNKFDTIASSLELGIIEWKAGHRFCRHSFVIDDIKFFELELARDF